MSKYSFLRIFCLMIAILMMMATACAAEVPEEQILQGAENRENALLITEEQYAQEWFAHVRTDQGTGKSLISPWYVVEAKEDGEFVFSVWNTANWAINMYVYDMQGNEVFDNFISVNEQRHATFQTVAGEKLYALFIPSEPFMDGYVKFSVCSDGCHVEQDYNEVAVEPACTEPGTLVYPCALCFEPYKTEEIPALGHNEGTPEVIEQATCMNVGKQIVSCSTCGEIISENELPMEKHVHGKMQVVSSATCVEKGYNEQRCINCYTLINSEEIPAYGHKGAEWETLKPVTCIADGIRVQNCVSCGMTMQQETIPAFGHSAGEWETVREADCSQSGLKEKKCSICDVVLESENADALGHRYTEWEIVAEATKEAEGEKMRHCIGCGDTQSQIIEKIEKFLGVF